LLENKKLPEQLISRIEEELKLVPYGKRPDSLYDPIRYILSLGGKRLRPVLVLLSGRIFSELSDERLFNMGLVAEVFHNFSLLHDDVMDEAPLRRGMPTVHEKWDVNTAILSGDVMLVLAYQILSKLPPKSLPFCMNAFNQVAREVCEGQQLDMEFEQKEIVLLDDYIEMIRLKTAVLLGFCCKTGAFLAGANDEQFNKLYTFGESIGLGFQLMDDYLDVFGDSSKFGKRVGGDIASNKKTYLLIRALELAKGEQLYMLNHWLSMHNENLLDDKVKFVTQVYVSLGIDKEVKRLAESYFEKGFEQLASLRKENPKVQDLELFAKELMMREK